MWLNLNCCDADWMARSVSMVTIASVPNTVLQRKGRKRTAISSILPPLYVILCCRSSVHTFQWGSVGQQHHLLRNRFRSGVVVDVLERTEAFTLCFAAGKMYKIWVLYDRLPYQIAGRVWHWSLVAVHDGFPCEHDVDGAGVDQPGDASFLTHWHN